MKNVHLTYLILLGQLLGYVQGVAQTYPSYAFSGVELELSQNVNLRFDKQVGEFHFLSHEKAYFHQDMNYSKEGRMENVAVEGSIIVSSPYFWTTPYQPLELARFDHRGYRISSGKSSQYQEVCATFSHLSLSVDDRWDESCTNGEYKQVHHITVHVWSSKNEELQASYYLESPHGWEVIRDAFQLQIALPVGMSLKYEENFGRDDHKRYKKRIHDCYEKSMQDFDQRMNRLNQVNTVHKDALLEVMLDERQRTEEHYRLLAENIKTYDFCRRQVLKDYRRILTCDYPLEDLKQYALYRKISPDIDSTIQRYLLAKSLDDLAMDFRDVLEFDYRREETTEVINSLFTSMFYSKLLGISQSSGRIDQYIQVEDYPERLINLNESVNHNYTVKCIDFQNEFRRVPSNLTFKERPWAIGKAMIFGNSIACKINEQFWIAPWNTDSLVFTSTAIWPLAVVQQSEVHVAYAIGYNIWSNYIYSKRQREGQKEFLNVENLYFSSANDTTKGYVLSQQLMGAQDWVGEPCGWSLQEYVSALTGNDCIVRFTVYQGDLTDVFMLENQKGTVIQLTFEEAKKHLMADVHFRNLLLISQMRVE